MQAKYRQHFLDNQIPHAEAEADRIAASVSGARTPEEVKSQLGEKMGADFSNVTFHTDSAALKQADAMGARAYTTGSDVYFGSGGFDPGVAAHELVHTVQQGMVGSTMQTTSAPTGGVQMKRSLSAWIKDRRAQKSARRRETYKEAARADRAKSKKQSRNAMCSFSKATPRLGPTVRIFEMPHPSCNLSMTRTRSYEIWNTSSLSIFWHRVTSRSETRRG